MRRVSSWIIGLAALLLVSFIGSKVWQARTLQSNLFQTPISAELTTEKSPDNSESSEAEDESEYGEDFEEAANDNLFECPPEVSHEAIVVEHSQFLKLLDTGSLWKPLALRRRCYLPGKNVNLLAVKLEDKKAYQIDARGIARVAEVIEVPLDHFRNDPRFLVTDDLYKTFMRAIRIRIKQTGEKMSDVKIKAVRLVPVQWHTSKLTYSTPRIHPGAVSIDKERLQNMLKRGVPIYDIRPAEAFGFDPIPGASHLPIQLSSRNLPPMGARALAENQIQFVASTLPPDKKMPFIVYSTCGADMFSYHGITLLRSLGYKKVFWFRGGSEFWKTGISCAPPEKQNQIRPIEADELSLLPAGSHIRIYVDSQTSHLTNMMPATTTLEYREDQNPNGLPKVRNLLPTAEDYLNLGDRFELESLEFPKGKTLVVFGDNDAQWAPLKVAMILKGRGYSDVRWYRKGLADWHNQALFKPRQFQTIPPLNRE